MKGAAYGISDGICDKTPGGACSKPGNMKCQSDGVAGLRCNQIKVWPARSVMKAVLSILVYAPSCCAI